MSKYQQQVQAYLTAHAKGDTEAVAKVLAEIPGAHLETFLTELEATGQIDDVELSQPSLESSLENTGLAPNDATLLSVLSAGTFADFVRTKFRQNSLNADSVLQVIDDSDDQITSEEQDDLAAWLEAVLDGDDPSHQLPASSLKALARACGASTDTLRSILERTPHQN